MDGVNYDVEIIDMSGQEEFRMMSEESLREGDAFFLVCVPLLTESEVELY